MLLLQDQQTPLHLSSERGHVDVVNALLSHGADTEVQNLVSKYEINIMYYNLCIDYIINYTANVYL